MGNEYKCLQCGEKVPQIVGKRHKLYCNATCKKRYQRSQNRDKKGQNIVTGRHNGTKTGAENDPISPIVLKEDRTPLRTDARNKPLPADVRSMAFLKATLGANCQCCGVRLQSGIAKYCRTCSQEMYAR